MTKFSPEILEIAQHTDVRKLTALSLRAQGQSWSAVSRTIGVSRRQVYDWRREEGWRVLEHALLQEAAARLLAEMPALVEKSASALHQALDCEWVSEGKLRAAALVLQTLVTFSSTAGDIPAPASGTPCQDPPVTGI